mmetsp:Transcript_27382/g.49294  ORF Transcript_27382/g.49294 Transcript_27382/m.49294 type:complete len:522 (+) Transcript_27382:1238-2803(+)
MSLQGIDFVKGNSVVKYSKSERPTQRILSLKDDCLVWHKTRRRKMPRRLRLFNILRTNLLCPSSKPGLPCAFTVETAFRTYKFQVEDEDTAQLWVAELRRKVKSAHMCDNTPTTDENENSTDSALQDTRDEEAVQDKDSVVLSKVQRILKKFVGKPVAAENVVECFSQLAKSRSSLINNLHGAVEEKQTQCQLSNYHENLIKVQLSTLEARKAAQGEKPLDEMREQVVSQQGVKMQLEREVEDTIKANLKLIEEEYQVKKKLETSVALSHNLERFIAREVKAAPDAKVKALQQGFQAYVCCFADADIREQINLTPRRPAEDGIYKKRHISVSQGNSVLVWKAIGLFVQKKAVLKFKDVERTRDGSPDVIRLQPFPGFVYLTLYSSNLTLVIAVEPQLSFYLDAIKQLHLNTHSLSARNIPESSVVSLLRNCKNHLATQASMHQRLLAKYVTNLEESICELSGLTGIEEYTNEVRLLRELSAAGVDGYLSGSAEDYMRKERSQLEQRLLNLSEIVVKVAEHL